MRNNCCKIHVNDGEKINIPTSGICSWDFHLFFFMIHPLDSPDPSSESFFRLDNSIWVAERLPKPRGVRVLLGGTSEEGFLLLLLLFLPLLAEDAATAAFFFPPSENSVG